MTRNLNIAAQLFAAAGQMLISPLPIGEEWKPFLHGLVAFAQLAVSLIAHSYTPQGEKIVNNG